MGADVTENKEYASENTVDDSMVLKILKGGNYIMYTYTIVVK